MCGNYVIYFWGLRLSRLYYLSCNIFVYIKLMEELIEGYCFDKYCYTIKKRFLNYYTFKLF